MIYALSILESTSEKTSSMNTGYPPVPGTITVVPVQFGDTPMQVTCSNCHKTVITTTVAENGACAWIAVLVMVFVFCPCFFIPLCIDSCKDIHHKCPSCGCQLGVYKKL
ncbi:lipopolysaccharide-induced tumor necrosis factor-alpha factor homolog isoform X1 [Parasteatoda tepidariorum]|uniref:lipopolysaccharide-induced tumor necrosis factor-alpha factor homolog isoform X1 n=2 Tax=Parasteatoda tepidariorum TaxID=114398 RepID=UPI001C71C99D|nr:lipopolysaccharide-induced tumor necrosis factor-alpha factor homolog [Parasteatoda tepidariorum]